MASSPQLQRALSAHGLVVTGSAAESAAAECVVAITPVGVSGGASYIPSAWEEPVGWSEALSPLAPRLAATLSGAALAPRQGDLADLFSLAPQDARELVGPLSALTAPLVAELPSEEPPATRRCAIIQVGGIRANRRTVHPVAVAEVSPEPDMDCQVRAERVGWGLGAGLGRGLGLGFELGLGRWLRLGFGLWLGLELELMLRLRLGLGFRFGLGFQVRVLVPWSGSCSCSRFQVAGRHLHIQGATP